MRAKHALILAFLLVILIANNLYVFSLLNQKAKTTIIVRTIDGDTIVTSEGETLRLLNINTPEKNKKGFEEAKNFLAQFENKTIRIEITEKDKYGRSLARVFTPQYLNLEIVRQGYANKYLVQESELNEFSEAEESAIKNTLGIWEISPGSNCITSKINPEKETIKIINSCSELKFKNWIVKEEGRKEYIFSDIAFSEINLHTKNGMNNKTDIFWNSAQNIWNDDRDTLYIFDSERRLVHHNSYGY